MTARRYITARAIRGLRLQLSDRDQAVLRFVSDLRFVSGDQLRRLHFGSDDADARAARRALSRLATLECLARLPRTVGGVRAGSAGFVYRLGIAGQRLAMDSGWQPERRPRRATTPGSLFLDHCLDVSELHVQLREAERDQREEGPELSELTAEPACHRDYAGLGSQRVLKPDSFVRFFLGPWEYSFFIEVDRGTEGSRTIEGKLIEYLRYEASGCEQTEHGVFPKVLWSAPDEARGEVIAEAIEQVAASRSELFTVTTFERVVAAMTTPGHEARPGDGLVPASTIERMEGGRK